MSAFRVGSGFDVHRLASGGPLRLGGIEIPWDRHLEGHSDGDCLLHAIGDALLGAVAAGDMGARFPSTDDRWRAASSRVFLEAIARIVASTGFAIGNVDATVIAQAPALGPHLEGMRNAISEALGLDRGAVSVKVKSADHLGAVGRVEGIAAQAVALVVKE